MKEAIRYCEYLDGECDYLICDNCKYNTKKKPELKAEPVTKLYRVSYEASLILSMPEPCGTMQEAICKGDFFICATNDKEADSLGWEIVEKNFLTDNISKLEVKEEPIPPDEFPCEECSFQTGGCCVLDFPCLEEDYAAQDIKDGD